MTSPPLYHPYRYGTDQVYTFMALKKSMKKTENMFSVRYAFLNT